jgi:hypothetical protein
VRRGRGGRVRRAGPAALLALVLLGAGCARFAPFARPAATALGAADALAERGEHGLALDAYDDFLRRFPDDAGATRARATRETLAELLASRRELVRLRQALEAREEELARLREALHRREADLARRDGDAARRDADLARARQEVTRLTAEADRLRSDLERLKQVDIRLERKR